MRGGGVGACAAGWVAVAGCAGAWRCAGDVGGAVTVIGAIGVTPDGAGCRRRLLRGLRWRLARRRRGGCRSCRCRGRYRRRRSVLCWLTLREFNTTHRTPEQEG